MNVPIAVLGLACEYPGAHSPEALWETALWKRRWFRRIPAARLGPEYQDMLGKTGDTTRLRRAAVLEGYTIPQHRFALGENDLRAADFTHWLALDCADRAVADSGLGDELPRDATRVIVGNSLTGESSRAELLRLRWPYVRKTLEESGCTGSEADWARRAQFFKARLTPIDGRTLAGSLSNVIAGRIASQLDLRGGAYCVDAACASSLVAVAQACSQLASGEIECCLVGGVDVSLDPLELVGFSVAGALAQEEMKIFDRRRSGFLPGEGCGFAMLMRADHPAVGRGRVRAFIHGWAVSSDGRHDLTAPSPRGQRLALERAYRMAGYSIGTVPFFEAHGTGTVVGDQVELETLSAVLTESGARGRAAVGSIKANIGHTKAAAGLAGLIKATLALETGVLPPTTGCEDPMPEVSSAGGRLRTLATPEPWPGDAPRRAGVSAFGFGGVNAHVTLENPAADRGRGTMVPCGWDGANEDAELFVFDGVDRDDLRGRLRRVFAMSLDLADAELPAAAKATALTLKYRPWRAAVIARTPEELNGRLAKVLEELATDLPSGGDDHACWREANPRPRIGFLFPGQGDQSSASPGAWWSRFSPLLDGLDLKPLRRGPDSPAAQLQSAVVTTAAAGTRLLAALGVTPTICLGHSLGEISALVAAGALSAGEAAALSAQRGRLMDEHMTGPGGMEALFTDEVRAREIINGYPVTIGAFNSARQLVVSGPIDAVEKVVRQARIASIATAQVSRRFAFHSTLMEAVVEPFRAQLRKTDFQKLQRPVYSTVTGNCLPPDVDLVAHLATQLTAPVQFQRALESARTKADLWIEVGTGRVLSALASPQQAISIEAGSTSLVPFLQALAMAHVQGADLRLEPLYVERCLPPLDLDWVPRFFTNPCERPLPRLEAETTPPVLLPRPVPPAALPLPETPLESPLPPREAVRRALVQRKGRGVALENIRDDQTLGPDLGVDSLGLTTLSLAVEQAVGGRAIGHPRKDMTVAEFAALFPSSPGLPVSPQGPSDPLVPWVRAFEITWGECPLENPSPATGHHHHGGAWTVVATSPLPFALPPSSPHPPGLLISCDHAGDDSFPDRLLAALRAHLPPAPVVFLDSTEQLGGFAKSLALEQPERSILFVHHPNGVPPDWEALEAELRAMKGFREVRYDVSGRRCLPQWRLIEHQTPEDKPPIDATDVVLVTGGARGITAECLLALAGATGAKFALVGRSSAGDRSVLDTRRKLAALGIPHDYWSLDVAEETSVGRLVQEVEQRLGRITALIHGAGLHHPCPVQDLTVDLLAEHTQAKVQGIRNLLATIPSAHLKLVAGFGSLIARTGYQRSAAYAYANDGLARLLANYQSAHPHVRCQTLDWSAWMETGMGVSLGAISALQAAGLDPIRTAHGTALFLAALGQPRFGPRPIISGRLPEMATVVFAGPRPAVDLPGAHVRSYVPGVELVAAVPVSLGSYPWLSGHALEGNIILPAVVAIEFMATLARTLSPSEDPTSIRNLRFTQPLIVPPSGELLLQIQAIRETHGTITCRLGPAGTSLTEPAVSAEFATTTTTTAAENDDRPTITLPCPTLSSAEGAAVASSVYAHLLFHRASFEAIERYSVATARQTVFHLQTISNPTAPLHDEALARDALIHGLQACVPGELLLPAGVHSIHRLAPAATCRTVIARETSASDGEFIYDVSALDANGHLVEQWTGLQLRRYRHFDHPAALHPVLQNIHAERTSAPIPPQQPASPPSAKRFYEYRHIVGFKETNVVGNVYFTNHLEWQGRCREMFLRDHAPDVLAEIEQGRLVLATVSCSCEYEQELRAFDEVSVRMTLESLHEDRASMRFEYWAQHDSGPLRIASGTQSIAARARYAGAPIFAPLPVALVAALQLFR